VYAVSGSLFAIAVDLRRLEVKGDAVPVVEGVSRAAAGTTGAANFSFSSSGSLIYLPGPVSGSSAQLALIDRSGAVAFLALPPGAYLSPRVSPDGTRVAFGLDDGHTEAVWLYDLAGTSAMHRLTFGGNNRFPIWTADGKRIAFQSDRDGDLAIFWQAADGTGVAERLTTAAKGESHAPESWAPERDMLLFSVTQGSDVALSALSLRDRKATPFGGIRASNSTEVGAVFSPDGRWVAYTSNEGGRATIYVQPFPTTGATYQLFAKGSDDPHHPAWSPDGKELLYVSRPGGFESVTVTTQPTFAYGNPKAVPGPFLLGPPAWRRPFDMTPGGKVLGLMLGHGGQTGSGTSAPQIQVVLNWFEELKARVP
jgi:serine/threonine-protein kinase